MDTDLQRRAERQGSSEKLRWHPGTSRAERRRDLGTDQGHGEQSGAVGTPWCPVEGVCPDVHGCPPRKATCVASCTLTQNFLVYSALGNSRVGRLWPLGSVDLGSNPCSVTSQLGDWASDFSLNLSISICKMGIIIASILEEFMK